MTLFLDANFVAAIRRQGEADYPRETCGLMAGSKRGESTRVTHLVPVTNTRTDSAHNRYLIDPEEYRRAQIELDAAGLEIVGIYHSHPDHPAQPSEFDREHALPWWSYVIVRVAAGHAQEVRSWRLVDDRSMFQEESITQDERKVAWQSPS